MALDEDEEPLAWFALAHQLLAGGQIDLSQDRRKAGALGLRARLKERDPRDESYLLVAPNDHGEESKGCGPGTASANSRAAAAHLGALGQLLALFDLERVAAATGRGGVGVRDLEPGLGDRVEEVDLGALEIRRAEGIHDNRDAVGLELVVALLQAAVEAERVLEPEQPPPCTATRRTFASPSGSSSWSSLIFAAAASVRETRVSARSMVAMLGW